MVDLRASAVALASTQVASASPIPETRNRKGALVATSVSTSTRSGLWGKNTYSSNTPSSV